MNTLFLIDGNAIMHRAYHAIPLFKTKSGLPTNAAYGFLSILNKVIVDYKPYYLIVCFDTPIPTFRKKLFKEYQSHRPKMEDDLSSQFSIVKELLDAGKIIHLEKEGYEADDVIGTISKKFQKNGDQVLILSGDRDILQLVDKNIFVITPQLGFSKEKMYNPEEVHNRFGIDPEQIPDFKALMGDASDNYKGAKGIGPKTAAKLLQQYHTVDNVLNNLNIIDGKIKTILEEHKKSVLMSHKLATILTDVEIDIDINKSKYVGFNENLKESMKKFEMYSLMNRIFPAKKTKEQNLKENKKKKNPDQIGLF
ncbi:MAG: 5'-3' exonuclease H3TH domain-containing protein [bacterium]|nr:5'-3' exonuclease H3TH domain-containing protein [bacterium]